MSKRFVDTELWQKAWFQDLDMKEKLLVLYLFQNCDNAGVWNINYRLAGFILGFEVNKDMIMKINEKNLLFDFFEDDKVWVLDFIKFQYGTLSENCKPHKPIIEKLKKYNLYQRVFKGYSKGINTLEEKEQEEEEEKEKDLSFLGTSFLSENQKLYGKYNNVCLDDVQYGKLLSLCLSNEMLNELINSFSINIEVGKERPYIADLPNAHYERLRSYYNFRKKYPDKFRGEEDYDIHDIVKQLEEDARKAGKL